jgi:hypothetical protein
MPHPSFAAAPPEARRERAFLELVPVVRRAARFRFRHIRCAHRRDDLVAETVALAWAWYARLVARGKDPAAFPAAFAALAARAAAAGRRLAGQEPGRDILAWACRRRHGFTVGPLANPPASGGAGFGEALADNTRSPVPVQVQFRADFPAWLEWLSARDRQVAVRLALGCRTSEVALAFGLTPARVSQLRGEFRQGYMRFLTGPGPGDR